MKMSSLVSIFPDKEKYLLVSQIIRSSRSITANIAEGYGRFTYLDTKNFFVIARGSTTETMEHLQTAFDEKYISEQQLTELKNDCEEVIRLINGYINYLINSNKNK